MAARSAMVRIVEPQGDDRGDLGFPALGAVLILLGVGAAMAAPRLMGVAMAAAGMAGIVHAVAMRHRMSALGWVLAELFYLEAALVVIRDPSFAKAALTLVLAGTLGASGLLRLAQRGGGRVRGCRRWISLSGAVSIGAAALIAGWPRGTDRIPDMVLTGDLLLQGVMGMCTGLALRSAAHRA
jgi:uncharacterized membrane protein HdeD (DUF308 family)